MLEAAWNAIPFKKRIATTVGGVILTAAVAGGIIAVDTAGDHVTQEEAASLRESGVGLLIQALTWWPKCGEPATIPGTATASLINVRTEGLDIAGYFLVDPHSSGRESVDRAKSAVPPGVWADLEFVALDYEIPSDCRPQYNVPWSTVVEALDRLKELGKTPVVYTNYDNWVSVLNNPTRPEGTYLWNASWDGDPDFDFPNKPYGGWTADEVFLEQYNGDTVRGGVYVDLNIIHNGVLPKPPEPYYDFKAKRFYNLGPDRWQWSVATGNWFLEDGTLIYGPCSSWEGRYNFTTQRWQHSGAKTEFWPERSLWYSPPPC